MFKETCCPSLRLMSFTTLVAITIIAMFIASCAWGGLVIPSRDFLTPKYETLTEFGNRDYFLIRNKLQVWRLLTAAFLHANFLHLFFNFISLLAIGSQIERIIGTTKMIVVFVLSAIGGNLFGAVASHAPAVGSSTAIFGLLGCFAGYIIINWNRVEAQTKCYMITMITFVIVMNIMFGIGTARGGGSQADNSGHLGGLITGCFVGMAIINPIGGAHSSFEIRIKRFGLLLTLIFLSLCTFLLFK